MVLFDRKPHTLSEMADRTPQKWVNIVLSTYSGVPKAQKLKRTFHSSHPFSFHPPHFIFIPIQHWIVIQLAQRGVRSVWGTTFKPRNSILPTTFCNPPPPWIPNEAGRVKEHFFCFTFISCVRWSPFQCHTLSFDLDTDQRRFLGLSTSLACNSWTSWFQHRGESWVGGGEDSVLTDVQYTQLMPQAGKSNNIICTGGSHIYYPICPSGGGWKYCNSSQHRNAHVKNFIMDIVRQLLAMPGIQIEKWGKMPHN